MAGGVGSQVFSCGHELETFHKLKSVNNSAGNRQQRLSVEIKVQEQHFMSTCQMAGGMFKLSGHLKDYQCFV